MSSDKVFLLAVSKIYVTLCISLFTCFFGIRLFSHADFTAKRTYSLLVTLSISACISISFISSSENLTEIVVVFFHVYSLTFIYICILKFCNNKIRELYYMIIYLHLQQSCIHVILYIFK